jgi:Mg-chelatase subunit ChlD
MNAEHEEHDAREVHEAQLTAYALDQLSAAEREAAERFLAGSAEARETVQQTAALAAHVRRAYQQAPTCETSATLREAIEERLRLVIDEEATRISVNPSTRPTRSRFGWPLAYLTACAVFAAAFFVGSFVYVSRPTDICLSSPCSRLYSPRLVADPSVVGRGMPAASSPYYMDDDVHYLQRPLGRGAGGEGRELSGHRYSGWREQGSGPSADQEAKPQVEHGFVQDEDKSIASPALTKRVTPRVVIQEQEEEMADVPFGGSGPIGPRGGGAMGGVRAELGPEVASPAFTPSPNVEQYDPVRENRFRSVARQPLSTFSIDVDTASYANVRRFLNEGRLPPPDAVRIEEMVNYFSYDYSPPSDETPFAVHLETAECPWQTAHRLVRIGLKGREVERRERGPSNFVFLLDVSGSMGEPNKLPLVKQAMRMLVEQLGEEDRVAIVTYANGTDLRLPSARGNERHRILGVIDSLEAGGCTYGSAGIELAYHEAEAHFVEGGVNRIILCTDGDLNVGVTNDDDLVKLIGRKAKSGVFLSVLGFGTGNLKDGKLEKLADKGNGVYGYVDGLREAHRLLVEQMTGSLVTIAKDVKIQVEFNPAEVAGYRLIGYENRVMANRDFDNDRKDAGEIGAGHTVTALYELVPT